MRLILEKSEIVMILSRHFDAVLDPEKVIIRTDPLEIEVCGLPLGSEDSAPKREDNVVMMEPARRQPKPSDVEKVKRRDDPDASVEPPPPGRDGGEETDEPGGGMHPAAILAASKKLEEELDRERNQNPTRKGGSSRAPTDFNDEV